MIVIRWIVQMQWDINERRERRKDRNGLYNEKVEGRM